MADVNNPYSDQDLLAASTVVYDPYVELYLFAQQEGNYPYDSYTLENLQAYAQIVMPDKTFGWSEKLDPEIWQEIKDWEVGFAYGENAHSGLMCMVLLTNERTAGILTVRGSEDMEKQFYQDWIKGDLGLLNSIQTQQQAEIDSMFIELNGSGCLNGLDWLASTGHSLGGIDAQYATLMAYYHGITINQCVAFDSPGSSLRFITLHFADYLREGSKITHYNWSPVGSLLFQGPYVTTHRLQTQPWGSYSVGAIGADGNFPELLGRHDPMSVWYAGNFDENGNFRPPDILMDTGRSLVYLTIGNFLPEGFDIRLSFISKALDTALFFSLFPDTRLFIESFEFNAFVLRLLVDTQTSAWNAEIAAALQARDWVVDTAIPATQGFIQKSIDIRIEAAVSVWNWAHDVAIPEMQRRLTEAVEFVSDVARRTYAFYVTAFQVGISLKLAAELFAIEFMESEIERGLQRIAEVFLLGALNARMTAGLFDSFAASIFAEAASSFFSDASGDLSVVFKDFIAFLEKFFISAANAANRASAGKLQMQKGASADVRPSSEERRRDFSQSAKAELFKALNAVVEERPFDIECWPEWHRMKDVAQREVPELYDACLGIRKLHELIEETHGTSKQEISRIFDRVNELDNSYAEKVRADICGLEAIVAEINNMRDSLPSRMPMD